MLIGVLYITEDAEIFMNLSWTGYTAANGAISATDFFSNHANV